MALCGVLCGVWWCLVADNGIYCCFLKIFHCVLWLFVAFCGVWWYLGAFGGVWWLSMVVGGFQWLPVAFGDV